MKFERVTQLTHAQFEQLDRLFQQEWWTKGRNINDIRKMVENSDLIFGYVESDTKELVGFARVLTDYVYKAFIFDVIVKESLRGYHLGRTILEAILANHSLQHIKHFELYCLPEMVPFYEKWGFTKNLGMLTFMRLENDK